ncbi:geranylgeranyl diphosphate synthase [Microdochium bolleyi]|uniref:Geranylgeranyl diphosphate synthase n=1 Tax=Microdochium bolleyi TaxID=196109 RepID=A0A136IJJ0_9PEZI|nr:geranylgeranyl diphosphate synthase [Microdochium bolleyi]
MIHKSHSKESQCPPLPSQLDASRYATADLSLSMTTWSDSKEEVLRGPFDYLYSRPGKETRKHILNALNRWLNIPQQSLDIITKVVDLLHTASLLVDDIEDGSQLRRGMPVAHSIFGTAQTINSANYIYFVALSELQRLDNHRANDIVLSELLNLHRGQGMDLFWRDNLACPSEDDYLEMVSNKTGGLFRVAIKLMQVESNISVDCVPLVDLIGLIFQIGDDYKNLADTTYTKNKGFCEDLTEGKFSFPIIHSIQSNHSNMELLHILRQKTTDIEVKGYALGCINKTGSLRYTEEVLRVLVQRARKLAHNLNKDCAENSEIYAILDNMVIQEEHH